MSKIYNDYFWKEGIPYGKGSLDTISAGNGEGYKIVMDPYRKRISIEKYVCNQFQSVIYDSALFNFRHLKPAEQNAWQKSIVNESANLMECLIRSQDDRVVIREKYEFKEGLCHICRAYSCHGYPISVQKMFYTRLHDAFDGVILFDQNAHPVIFKRYAIDEKTGEFTDLLQEEWNMEHPLKDVQEIMVQNRIR